MKLGIIGLGFVGSSVKHAYDVANIETICIDPAKGINSNYDDVMATKAMFICVPSPQSDDGSCNTEILESVLNQYKDYTGIFISKVTANPLKYKELQTQYKNLVHAPEFLVAATAKEDYISGQFTIVGGNQEYLEPALEIIKLGQPKINNFKFCSIQEAALAKYTINSFLATKVVFMNHIKMLSDALESNYNVLTECITMDQRIGNSHLSVPGPDGQYGFGGACFPKDTSALSHLAHMLGIDCTVLDAAIKTNKTLRNDL